LGSEEIFMNNVNFLRKLRDYQKRVKKCEGLYKDERNTTIKFIVPLLNILGWNQLSKEMEFEYVVKGKGLKHSSRVDIALYAKSSEKPDILVEIKRLKKDSDDLGTGRQMLRYLSAAKIKYGIYTNGKKLMLLDNRTPTEYMPEGLFVIKVEDFVDYGKVLAALSKDSIKQKKLERLVKDYHSQDFWDFIKKKEKRVKRSGREDLKYKLRLEYAMKKLLR